MYKSSFLGPKWKKECFIQFSLALAATGRPPSQSSPLLVIINLAKSLLINFVDFSQYSSGRQVAIPSSAPRVPTPFQIMTSVSLKKAESLYDIVRHPIWGCLWVRWSVRNTFGRREDTACYETEKELRMRTSTGPLGMCSEGFPLWNCGVCKIIGKETFW